MVKRRAVSTRTTTGKLKFLFCMLWLLNCPSNNKVCRVCGWCTRTAKINIFPLPFPCCECRPTIKERQLLLSVEAFTNGSVNKVTTKKTNKKNKKIHTELNSIRIEYSLIISVLVLIIRGIEFNDPIKSISSLFFFSISPAASTISNDALNESTPPPPTSFSVIRVLCVCLNSFPILSQKRDNRVDAHHRGRLVSPSHFLPDVTYYLSLPFLCIHPSIMFWSRINRFPAFALAPFFHVVSSSLPDTN